MGFGSSLSSSFVRNCGVVALLCAAWNLLGDLYYMDFFTAHNSEDEFGMLRQDLQSGYLFNFSGSWIGFLVQAGGWMYPIWAFVTAFPLYVGLQESRQQQQQQQDAATNNNKSNSDFRNRLVPCVLLAYGLCVVGGAFHGAFAFITVVPSLYHYPPDDANNWSDLKEESTNDQFFLFMNTAQGKIIQHIFWGGLPGLVACNVGSIWTAFVVQFQGPTQFFPKWFNLFNPLVTTVWVQIFGAMLPQPVGLYFVGCLATWSFLIFNMATTYYVWRGIVKNGRQEMLNEQPLSPSLLQQTPTPKSPVVTTQNYNSM